jgi:glycosyltransferase 2 family protein
MNPQFDLRNRAATRRILRLVLIALIVGIGANILLSLLAERGQYLGSLLKVRAVYIIVPLLLFIAGQALDGLRLMLVLSQFRIRIRFLSAFYNSAAGIFFLNVTPLSSGAQAFQVYHLNAIGVPLETSTNIIVSRFAEQALTSMLIVLLSLTQVPWIAASLGIDPRLIFAGLGVTLALTALVVFFLFRPHLLGRLAIALQGTALGRLVTRVSGRRSWARSLHRWSHRLRANVRLLWARKTPIMLLDMLLGLVLIVMHAWSVQFVVQGITEKTLPAAMVFITYVILWQVVIYVPTPGASGGVEGAFTLVYGSMTGSLGQTAAAILVWRFATYYLLILFDGLVYALLARAAGRAHRVSAVR